MRRRSPLQSWWWRTVPRLAECILAVRETRTRSCGDMESARLDLEVVDRAQVQAGRREESRVGRIVNVDGEEAVRRQALQRVGVASLESDSRQLVAGRRRAGKQLQALMCVHENRTRRIAQIDDPQDGTLGHRRRAVGEVEAGKGVPVEVRRRRRPGSAGIGEERTSGRAVRIAACSLAGRSAGHRGIAADDVRRAQVRLACVPSCFARIQTAVDPSASATCVAAVVAGVVLWPAGSGAVRVARLDIDEGIAEVTAGRRTREAAWRRRRRRTFVRKRSAGADAGGSAARSVAGVRARRRCRCASVERSA